jgi:excisionase family DNA binding protein
MAVTTEWTHTPRLLDKLLLRPIEVAELLSISRTKAYELIAAGVLPSVRVGASVRVPAAQLRTWIETHSTAAVEREASSERRRKSALAIG